MIAETTTAADRIADPTILTTQLVNREFAGVERELGLRQETRQHNDEAAAKLMDVRIDGLNAINAERDVSIRRESAIREEYRKEVAGLNENHRLELRAGDEKALTTALTAAKEAVREALSASEKARDQQNIANQLAADKAEQAFTKAMALQGATFTAAIGSLTDGLGEVKSALIALTSEKRGGQEQVVDRRANWGLLMALASLFVLIFGGVIGAALIQTLGG